MSKLDNERVKGILKTDGIRFVNEDGEELILTGWGAANWQNVEIPMGITLTEEENDEISQKVTAVRTMIEEYMIKYIIGTDNTDFETFKAQLNEYGYQDIIDTYQAAFDRYNAR